MLAEFERLWSDVDALWEQYQATPPFRDYVSADYLAVYESLARLRGSAFTFLEWGAGLGVVAIMASRMGFDAYGIEAELGLVKHSEELARKYGSNARFAHGSFIPDGFEWDLAGGDYASRTITDIAAVYDELDMELQDFDLIYAYPWPDEHTLYHNIIRGYGRSDALLLSYDAREGVEVIRFNDV